MESRNEAFRKLKAPCVTLSQTMLALNGRHGTLPQVLDALQDLRDVLAKIVNDPQSLDEQLADYVFFPLSQVLKSSQKVSLRILELCFESLSLLIEYGWRSKIRLQLAVQIIFLCTLMADKSPQGLSVLESTDELRANALWCLHHLFRSIDPDSKVHRDLINEASFPQLGQTITTILDAIITSESVELQLAGTRALQSLIENVATVDIRAAFLPGIVSKLTKLLTPETRQRRNHDVLIGAIDVLCTLLRSTMKGQAPGTQDSEDRKVAPAPIANPPKVQIIDEQWLKTAASRLRPALTNIMRLQTHSRRDVKEALARLCIVVLTDGNSTLPECSALCIEALVVLSTDVDGSEIIKLLHDLSTNDGRVRDLLVEHVYNGARSLPTRIQAVDEQVRLVALTRLKTAYSIVLGTGIDLGTTRRQLYDAVRDSIVLVLGTSKSKAAAAVAPVQSLDLTVLDTQSPTMTYSSQLVADHAQTKTMAALADLVSMISRVNEGSSLPASKRDIRRARGDDQIAAVYMLMHGLESVMGQAASIEGFLVGDNTSRELIHRPLETLYSFALDVLSDLDDEPTDPRLLALALRSLALRARYEGRTFRQELIDALYPVLHTLATPDEILQHDSIATLNIFVSACEYASVKELVVENVDYLTNAVSLKLNAFDVGPQAPQVLLMMVRLAGPSLLPFLEDTIDSIFAALENYHGYSLLVELLFRVLSVVAEEGTKAPQLSITDGSKREFLYIRNEHWQPYAVVDLAGRIASRREEALAMKEEATHTSHPKVPWKEAKDAAGLADGQQTEEEDEEEDESSRPPDEIALPPPAPKTYNLLFKITELTQHYLPSASPSLRASLLQLIKTTTPAIARHETSFLPLINTLWPEIVSRLDDPEPHVVAASLDITAVLCEFAGDFMRSRITKLWPRLVEIHASVARDIVHAGKTVVGKKSRGGKSMDTSVMRSQELNDAVTKMRSRPADYVDTSARLVWQALVGVVTSAVRHVALPPDLMDEALEMMEPVLAEEDVASAFEKDNADAVWLVRWRSGAVAAPQIPSSGNRWAFVAVS